MCKIHLTWMMLVVALVVIIAGATVGGSGCGVFKDSQLQSRIKAELKNHRDISYDKLTVNVRDGVVTVSGELNTPEEIELVVQVVTAIEGVESVRNQMSLPDNFQSSNPTFLYPF